MMHQLTYWYLEAEAYKLNGDVFIKEIAILKGDRTQCYTFHVNQHAFSLPTSEEYTWQKSKLGLSWSYGNHTLDEAIALIKEKTVEEDLIFVSDPEISLFLKQYFPKITYQPCEIGFQMIHCPSENCDVRHGDQCARRKVHEIRYADNHEL
jgi:hypothetical protein